MRTYVNVEIEEEKQAVEKKKEKIEEKEKYEANERV